MKWDEHKKAIKNVETIIATVSLIVAYKKIVSIIYLENRTVLHLKTLLNEQTETKFFFDCLNEQIQNEIDTIFVYGFFLNFNPSAIVLKNPVGVEIHWAPMRFRVSVSRQHLIRYNRI
jgi:hypothetical protein